MFTTLRTKLLLGLTPLLSIMVGLGVWAVAMLDHLGGRIDVILRENYASVLAAEGMKEALERMDSAALFAVNGHDQPARTQFLANKSLFERNLAREQKNVTIPGEQELADRLSGLYGNYLARTASFYDLPQGEIGARWNFYSAELLPIFSAIKDKADEVLRINQANMESENRKARDAARGSKQVMLGALLAAAGAASVIALVLSRSILAPIRAVTLSARAMSQGDYDQVVPVTSRDELGQLADTFNGMARTLRDYRQAGTARLVRAQQTAQATIDSFPDPVVVVDPSGAVERANPAARRILGVVPTDARIPWVAPLPLREPLIDVLGGRENYLPSGSQQAMSLRDNGQERFYLPRVLGIGGHHGPLGAAVVLQDVTKFRLVDQLKSDMVATVSHELKTPLTSIQMAVHLLLEELVGPLGPKQVELLLAARQDADRLLTMVNDLLDLTRIEQGQVMLDLHPEPAATLARAAVGRFEAQAQDQGITLTVEATPELPPVLVDAERITHVFDNLISNALQHTGRGKTVRLTAAFVGSFVEFAVADSGEGIAPGHLPRVFERFYRVPGGRPGGAGLGLAIAREVVVGHNGQIEVASKPGHGTTFTFRLPIAGTAIKPTATPGVLS